MSPRPRRRWHVRPASGAIAVHTADGLPVRDAHGSPELVPVRAVVAGLRDRLTTPVLSSTRVEVTTDDEHRCVNVDVEISCTWGTDLRTAGADVRERVAAALVELVGRDPSFDPLLQVRVHVGDVAIGEERLP